MFSDMIFAMSADRQNGQSKGTAYVQFQNLSSAQVALDAMDNFEIAGRPSES
jgi:RNA recognition motif-containing protein